MEKPIDITPFDSELQSKDLLILKTMIPYLTGQKQRTLALMTKYLELQKTAQLFNGNNISIQSCSITDPQERMMQMLTDIRKLCDEKEQENIDLLLNMFQMFSAYELLFN